MFYAANNQPARGEGYMVKSFMFRGRLHHKFRFAGPTLKNTKDGACVHSLKYGVNLECKENK
jgi:hypothetical protein